MGQFPPLLGPGSRLGRHGGLLVTGGLALVLANVVDLSAIASVGSACSLVVFLLVGFAGYRRRSETGPSGAVILLGIAATVIVLGFFAVDNDSLSIARSLVGGQGTMCTTTTLVPWLPISSPR
jgi:hypothetical protein